MTITLKPAQPTARVPMNKTVDELGIKPLTETAMRMMIATAALTDRRPGQ